jgi:excisionase family DNA binding protein
LATNVKQTKGKVSEKGVQMNHRKYITIFKNEPDILTVPDIVRLLKLGKNSVYRLIKEGKISSIKQGKKIIVPKICLVEFLTDAGNYQAPSPTVPNNLWTYEDGCDSVGAAREDKGQFQKKGA